MTTLRNLPRLYIDEKTRWCQTILYDDNDRYILLVVFFTIFIKKEARWDIFFEEFQVEYLYVVDQKGTRDSQQIHDIDMSQASVK